MGPAVLLGLILLVLSALVLLITVVVSGLVRFWKYVLRLFIISHLRIW